MSNNKNTLKVTCTDIKRNDKGIILGYTLKDNKGNIKSLKSADLKELIRTEKIVVNNLTLTSDNRLVTKQIKEEHKPNTKLTPKLTPKPEQKQSEKEDLPEDEFMDLILREDDRTRRIQEACNIINTVIFDNDTSELEDFIIGVSIETVEELVIEEEEAVRKVIYSPEDIANQILYNIYYATESRTSKYAGDKFNELVYKIRELGIRDFGIETIIKLQLAIYVEISSSNNRSDTDKENGLKGLISKDYKLLKTLTDNKKPDDQGKIKLNVIEVRKHLDKLLDRFIKEENKKLNIIQ